MQHIRVIVDPSWEIHFSFHSLAVSTLAHFCKFGRFYGPGILTLHGRKVLMGRIIRLIKCLLRQDVHEMGTVNLLG